MFDLELPKEELRGSFCEFLARICAKLQVLRIRLKLYQVTSTLQPTNPQSKHTTCLLLRPCDHFVSALTHTYSNSRVPIKTLGDLLGLAEYYLHMVPSSLVQNKGKLLSVKFFPRD